jgi:hypothetical protein
VTLSEDHSAAAASAETGERTSAMIDFGPAVILGLCFGFMFGTGCSLAIMYSIYLGGYRKAVEESMEPVRPKRFTQALEKLQARRVQDAAAAAARK